LLVKIIKEYRLIQQQITHLASNDGAVQDMRQQLGYLIYKNFIRLTPFEHLQSFPRYLQAVQYRLEKMFQAGDKDLQKQQKIARYQKWFWDSMAKQAKSGLVVPEQEHFRWMLEEFRVSLFAQQLKTAYPVSAKRLEKVWNSQ